MGVARRKQEIIYWKNMTLADLDPAIAWSSPLQNRPGMFVRSVLQLNPKILVTEFHAALVFTIN